MRALFAASLGVALVGWGHHAEVRAVVALVLVVATVCMLEASPRSDRDGVVTR